MSWINGGKVPGTKVPGSESSQELSFTGAKGLGHFGPGSEMARERNGQGAKGPRSERAREQIGQGPIGRLAPGSELAWERKGCKSFHHTSYC